MSGIYRMLFLCSGLCVSHGLLAAAAGSDPSQQQVLDQLRLLQQRFTNGSNGEHKSEREQVPPKAVAVESKTTVLPTLKEHPTNVVVPSDKTTVNELAFAGVTQQVFPLTPAQIGQLKQRQKQQVFAEESPVGTPPKPTATSQFVNLSPGAVPPVIRLSQGFVSSLVFLDSTGSPWPISAYDLGDPTAFNIQWDKMSNTLMIQSNKLYTYGNLAVKLKGLNTPVMLTLIPGQKAVDYRVDLRVQGYGPNATNLPLDEGLPPSVNNVLLHVLEGVPPAGSIRLTVSGGDARAWVVHEKMYVRTNLTVLSPGWIGSMTSADGMHAYEMQKAPVLLVSWHGKVMQLKVEGL